MAVIPSLNRLQAEPIWEMSVKSLTAPNQQALRRSEMVDSLDLHRRDHENGRTTDMARATP
jgi:hypothetical protein